MKLKAIGYFSKPHGLKGHLVLQTSFDLKSEPKALFIEMSGSHAPFFIEEIKPFKDGYLVKLEGYNSLEASGKLKNKEVLTEEKFIAAEKGFEYAGFILIDKLKGELGQIEELIDTPGNPLLRVTFAGKEILLPYNKHFVEKVKKTEKQLVYNAPEGLIDMYLGSE